MDNSNMSLTDAYFNNELLIQPTIKRYEYIPNGYFRHIIDDAFIQKYYPYHLAFRIGYSLDHLQVYFSLAASHIIAIFFKDIAKKYHEFQYFSYNLKLNLLYDKLLANNKEWMYQNFYNIDNPGYYKQYIMKPFVLKQYNIFIIPDTSTLYQQYNNDNPQLIDKYLLLMSSDIINDEFARLIAPYKLLELANINEDFS